MCLVAQSCPTLWDPMDCSLPGSSVHGDSPGKNTGVGCHALLQGIFPTQGSNSGLLHCRQILYWLSHQGTLNELMNRWIRAFLSMEFSRQEYWSGLLSPSLGDLPDPGIEPGFPTLHADSLPSEPPGKPQIISSVQFSHSVMSHSLWPHRLQHTRPPCPLPTPGIYSNSCSLNWWSHPTISSSVIPFSSHLQSFPASGSFQMSQFFASVGQSIGISALASVLPMDIQDWNKIFMK